MAAEIPKKEPSEFRKGDTVKWTKCLPDYLAFASWILTYEFRGVASISLGMTGSPAPILANGADFAITIPAATTATYNIGKYWWDAFVTKSTERYLVASGELEIKQNLAATLATYDGRTHVKKVLDAIEAVIESRATTDQENITVGGRTLGRTPTQNLILLRDRYKAEYNRDLQGARIKQGLNSKRKIIVRF